MNSRKQKKRQKVSTQIYHLLSNTPRFFLFSLITAALILLSLPSYSAQQNNNGEKETEKTPARIKVIVEGVKEPLLHNVYSSLAIYRLRSSSRLQHISVSQLYRQAEEDIRQALAPYGYYNPKISSELKALPPLQAKESDRSLQIPRWQAKFTIKKGQPVRIAASAIKISGAGRENAAISAKASAFPLKKGDILNQERYEKEKKELLNTAIAEGYLDAAFAKSEIRIDPEENRARIHLQLTTGEQYHFGKTRIITNPPGFWSEAAAAGYLPYKEGEAYSIGKLFELQSILYRTGYFSAVIVQGKIDEEENGSIPVEVQLMPLKANNAYTVGLGYATDSGARLRLNWKSRMFTDSGDKMGASIEVAETERNIFLSYERPRRQDPRYDKYTFTSSWQDKSWEETDTRLLTISGGREYSGPLFTLAGGVELRNEIYEIGDEIELEDDSATLLIPFGTAGIVKADDAVNPQNGIRLSVGAKGAAEGVIADTSFFQWTVSGKLIFTPSFLIENVKDMAEHLKGGKETAEGAKKKAAWRLVGRASFGMTMVDQIDSIPPSLRFYAGGDNSVRGYAYKSIGPRKNGRGAVIGGRYLSVQSVEIERFFGEYFGIALFWDVGTAADDLSLNYRQGAGIGLRGRLPFGEVKLDAASAISEDGYPVRIHFGVGGNL